MNGHTSPVVYLNLVFREEKKNPSPSNRDRYSGEKVPTLQEAVEECITHQLTIFFDVKNEPDKVGKKNNVLTQDANMKCGISLG